MNTIEKNAQSESSAPQSAAPVVEVAPLGQTTSHGMAMMFGQTVVVKFITFLSQIALSRLLSKNDFGIATESSSATAFSAPIAQVGVREVLVRNGAQFDRLYGPGIWISGLFGSLCSLMIVLSIPLAWLFFYGANPTQTHPDETRKLAGLMLLIAVSVLFNTLAFAPMARLQVQLRFRLISVIAFGQGAGLVLISVLFAWARFGAYSLVLAWPIVAAVRLGFLLAYAKLPRSWKPGLRHWRLLLGGGAMLLGVRVCATFIASGDYLMLGHYCGATTVGVYFFAFNLSMQTITLLSTNVESVLFPALSSIQHDSERQRNAFLSGISLLALIGIPLCFLQAGLAGPGVRLVFQPRWYAAIPVIQILSIGMAMRLFTSPSGSLLQAQGRFSKFLLVTLVGAVVFMTAVTIAAKHGDEQTVAAAVGGYFALEGPVMIYISLAGGKRAARDVVRALGFPVLAAAVAVGIGTWVSSRLPAMRFRDLVCLIFNSSVSIAIYGILVYRFAPDRWQLLVYRIRGLKLGKSSAPDR